MSRGGSRPGSGAAARAGGAHVVLIGHRGAGKSTVGRALAQHLGCELHDTDEAIQAEAGRSIAEIFQQDGEAAFRDLESEAIRRAVARPAGVISVGGGALLRPANRDLLREAGLCVWLRASVEEHGRRLAADPCSATLRPRLTDAPAARAELEQLLAQREPLYAAIASVTIQTDGRSVDTIVAEIASALRLRAPDGGGAAEAPAARGRRE
ncbi:MAG: shikimate kinase [Phycisphaerae bacterium]|nr:shikimate kinase [Phycisphaerae bacterium]MCZ2398533.1 shikimate kinase [Phycisphaerae bacterium]